MTTCAKTGQNQTLLKINKIMCEIRLKTQVSAPQKYPKNDKKLGETIPISGISTGLKNVVLRLEKCEIRLKTGSLC